MSSKKKMKVLEAVVRGCVWDEDRAGLEAFQPYAVCLIDPLPTVDNSPTPAELLQKGQREEQRKFKTHFPLNVTSATNVMFKCLRFPSSYSPNLFKAIIVKKRMTLFKQPEVIELYLHSWNIIIGVKSSIKANKEVAAFLP